MTGMAALPVRAAPPPDRRAGFTLPPRLQAGFTLIEVLVAFVLAALALGVFYEGTVGGLFGARTAGMYEEALSLARSHLAELTAHGAKTPVNAAGEDGKVFHYRIVVTPLASQPLDRTLLEQANNRPARVETLFGISITESWKAGRHRREVHLLGEALGLQAGAQ